MKTYYVSLLLFSVAPTSAFVVPLPMFGSSVIERASSSLLPLPPRQTRMPSVTPKVENGIEKEYDLEFATAQVDAALAEARDALDAQAYYPKRKFPGEALSQNIDDALDAAFELVDELQEERREFEEMLQREREDPQNLIDADFILGEAAAKEAVELLSKGLMSAEDFQDFVQERKYKSQRETAEMAVRAKIVMEQREEKAMLLQREIRRTVIRRRKEEKRAYTITVAVDGGMIGCGLAIYAWCAYPEYFEQISPAVLAIAAAGILSCTCVVASTSGTPVAVLMEKARFGFVSRTIGNLIAEILTFVAELLGLIGDAIAALPGATTDALASSMNAVNRNEREFVNELKSYREKKRRKRD